VEDFMKTVDSVNWTDLLEQTKTTQKIIKRWANANLKTKEVVEKLNGNQCTEFRRLVRNNGTTYGRRLARKALSYRGV